MSLIGLVKQEIIMFNIHVKNEVSTIRLFKEGESYGSRDSPYLSLTAHYISDSEVYLCNASGEVSLPVIKTLLVFFKDKGYRVLRYERKNKLITVDINNMKKVCSTY